MKTKTKTEIEKINKGCGKRFEISENRLAICGKYYYDEKEQTLCPTCQAEISALKKGISACEEILNSQQNKCMANDKKPSTKSSSGSHKLNLQQREEESADTQTLIKQALSQRNKEILDRLSKKEFIMSILSDCVSVDEEEGMKFIYVDDVRKKFEQQLTTEGEGKK